MKKRILSFLTMLCMITALLPANIITVFAATNGYLTYSISNNEVTITKCLTTASGKITIPNTLEGYPVTKIQSGAFSYCSKITGVSIPDNVKTIGSSAFYNCTKLTDIDIHEGITSIGSDAFYYTGYYTQNSNWVNDCLYLGKYLLDIRYSFSGTCHIKTGTLLIADEAFYKSQITNVDIPDSVINIGDSAFCTCDNLSYITIGSGVKNISANAFSYSINIIDITVDINNSDFTSYSGDLYSKDKTVLIAYSRGKSSTDFEIPNSVKVIGDYAFMGSKNLTSVSIPSSVTEICNYAFYKCDNLAKVNITDLKSWCNIVFGSSLSSPLYYAKNLYYNGNLITDLHIPNGVTKINAYVFSDCESLKNVTIPNSITSVEKYAFSSCKNLSTIDFGKGITKLGESAFIYCNSLTNIVIPENVKTIDIGAFQCCDKLESVTFPNNVTEIKGSIFDGCDNLNKVILPTNLTEIPAYMFYNCKSLKNVDIPNTVTLIGSNAFACSGITRAIISDNVTAIELSAFRECASLETVTIGKNVETIGESAFSGCVNVKAIQWNAKNLTLDLDEYDDNYVFDEVGINGDGVTLTFGDQVETIPNNAFQSEDCKPFLKKVIIGEKIKYIPYLGGKTSEITLGSSVETAYSQTIEKVYISDLKRYISFNGYGISPQKIYVNGILLTQIDVESGSKELPKCIINSNITTINIPASVTSINASDFVYASNLKTVNISKNNPNYLSENNVIFNKTKTEIVLYPQGKQDVTYIIPDSVTSINDYAFYECKLIKNITIPKDVTYIGKFAFYYMSLLEKINWNAVDIKTYNSTFEYAGRNSTGIEVVFGNDVKTIPTYAFYTSYQTSPKIISVEFGSNIKTIENGAFYQCSTIQKVMIKDISSWCNVEFGGWSANPLYYGDLYIAGEKVNELIIPNGTTQINDYSFNNTSNLTSLVIPVTIEKIGQYAFDRCSNVTQIYFNGTEEKYKTINIAKNNSIFDSASKIFYADVKIYDTNGILLSNTRQDIGKNLDISEIKIPENKILKLYKNREMTEQYSIDTPINENVVLYADFMEVIGTKTTVSEDGKTFTIKPINIASGNTVILALYNGEEFVTMQSAVYSGKDIPFTMTDKTYTTAKVMVWNNLDDITPICDVEIVK